MIKQKQLIDIIKNPSKYTKSEENFCKLINVLLVEINRLTNKLTIYQQNILNEKYGYLQQNCIAQKANDIALFSMFSPNLLLNNEQRLINLINRYIHILMLLKSQTPTVPAPPVVVPTPVVPVAPVAPVVPIVPVAPVVPIPPVVPVAPVAPVVPIVPVAPVVPIPPVVPVVPVAPVAPVVPIPPVVVTPSSIIDDINALINKHTLDELLKPPYFFRDRKYDNIKVTDDKLQNLLKNSDDGLQFKNALLKDDAAKKNSNKEFSQKKEFYDLMTNLISSEVVFTENKQEEIFNFQFLINNFFNRKINEYKKRNNYDDEFIKFIYKGGTSMKIIYEKYKEVYKNNGIIFDRLTDNFKRSDSDYQLFIRHDKENPEDTEERRTFVLYDMTVLTYNILSVIKKYLSNDENYNKILPLNTINEDTLKYKLEEINSKLSKRKKELPLFEKIEKFIGLSFDNKDYFSENIPDNFEIYFIEKNDDIVDEYTDDKEDIDTEDKEDIDTEDKEDIDIEDVVYKYRKGPKYYKKSVKNLSNNKYIEFKNNKKINSNKKDYFITTVPENNKNYSKLIHIKNDNNKKSLFYYLNDTNIFTSFKEDLVSLKLINFNLSRIKLNFIAYYKTFNGKYGWISFPAELVDISIAKANDEKSDFHSFSTYKKYLNGIELVFNSYSLLGFIDDLFILLLTESKYPWLDPKYEKRTSRLFLLLLIYLNTLFKREEMEQIIYKLSKIFRNCIENRETNTSPLDSKCFSNLNTSIDKKYEKEISIFNRIFKKIQVINDNLNEEKDINQKNEYVENYIKFINVFINILDIFKPINLDKEDQEILVPYLKKYLKYKLKYNQLKKKFN
jgi:hypothetical protein